MTRFLRAALTGLALWLPVHLTVARDIDPAWTLILETNLHNSGLVTSYSQVLPPRECRLLRSLACGHADCRATAEESIRATGRDGFRMVLWGCWSKDREVASRCEAMLADLMADRSPCPHCDGAGICRFRRDARYCKSCLDLPGKRWRADQPVACIICNGTGDSRPDKQGD